MAARTPVRDRLAPLRLPDQTGRRVVVTGASSGIGQATAKALALAGADVVLAVRDAARGQAAVDRIRAAGASGGLAVELVELGSLDSIADAAGHIGASPVHLLINNAGLSTSDASARTADGFPLQVGVNYLGAWALTWGLWPALLAGGPSRVVMLGSVMSRRGQLTEELGRPGEDIVRDYSNSKLATLAFALELDRRCRAAAVGVRAVAAHPGWAQTAIFDQAGPPAVVDHVGRWLGALQSPADGAQPVLLAATEPDPARYYGPTRRMGCAGPAGPADPPAQALAAGIGEVLWRVSAERTGVAPLL